MNRNNRSKSALMTTKKKRKTCKRTNWTKKMTGTKSPMMTGSTMNPMSAKNCCPKTSGNYPRRLRGRRGRWPVLQPLK